MEDLTVAQASGVMDMAGYYQNIASNTRFGVMERPAKNLGLNKSLKRANEARALSSSQILQERKDKKTAYGLGAVKVKLDASLWQWPGNGNKGNMRAVRK